MRRFFLANQPDFDKLAQMVCEDVAADRLTGGLILMVDFTEKGLDGLPSDRKDEYESLRAKLGLFGGIACNSGEAIFYTQLNTFGSGGRRGYVRLPREDGKIKETVVTDIDDRMPIGVLEVYTPLTKRWYLLRQLR